MCASLPVPVPIAPITSPILFSRSNGLWLKKPCNPMISPFFSCTSSPEMVVAVVAAAVAVMVAVVAAVVAVAVIVAAAATVVVAVVVVDSTAKVH